MNTIERSAEIRAALKRNGWNSRQVSVRGEYFSMGSEIRVEIKDVCVPIGVVRAIAENHESIARDEMTGEILSGGNRYVHVRYSPEVVAILTRRYVGAVENAVNEIPTDSNVLARIAGTEYSIGYRNGRYTLWNDSSYVRDAYTCDEAAECIALNIADAVQS